MEIQDKEKLIEALQNWRDNEPGFVSIPLEWITGEETTSGASCFSRKHYESATVRTIDDLGKLDFIAFKRAKLQKELDELGGK